MDKFYHEIVKNTGAEIYDVSSVAIVRTVVGTFEASNFIWFCSLYTYSRTYTTYIPYSMWYVKTFAFANNGRNYE